jgi:hypothetical protein
MKKVIFEPVANVRKEIWVSFSNICIGSPIMHNLVPPFNLAEE